MNFFKRNAHAVHDIFTEVQTMKKFFFWFMLFFFIPVFPAISMAREGVVKGSYVNVRAGADFKSEIISKQVRGKKYSVIHEDRGWLKVRFSDGTEGWIYETLTEKRRGNEEKTPESEAGVSSPTLPLPTIPEAVASGVKVALPSETTPKELKVNDKEKGKNDYEKAASVLSEKKQLQPTSEATAKEKPIEKKTEKEKKSEKDLTREKAQEKGSKKDEGKDKKKATEQAKAKENEKAKEGEKALQEKVGEKEKEKKPKEKKGKKEISEVSETSGGQTSEAATPSKILSSSKTPEEYYNEAIDLYEKKKFSEALEANKRALELAPKNPEIMNNMANCLLKLKRIDQALEEWKKALEISPKSAKICNNMGIAYYDSDDNEKAIEYYKKAILFEPDFPDPYYNLASVYGFKGEYKEALNYYRKYLSFSLDPTMKQLTEERIEYCQKQLEAAAKKEGKKENKN